jgi:hypothetical protein
MTKRAGKNIKENCFKSVKALKVIAILTAYLYDFLFNSKSTYQAPFRIVRRGYVLLGISVIMVAHTRF